MKIFHHDDIDGRSSAFLVKLALEKGYIQPEKTYFEKFIEMNYTTPFPIEDILKDEIVIIVDFSVKPPIMDKILSKTSNVIWIDHHQTAIDTYKDYTNKNKIKGIQFSDENNLISGAGLTYLYFFENCKTKEDYIVKFDKIPYWVMLISDFDTFANKLKPKSYFFKLYLESIKNNPDNENWETIAEMSHEEIENCINSASIIDSYLKETSEDLIKNTGFAKTIDGYNAFILNSNRKGSFQFNDNFNKYDICIVCYYDSKKWCYSIYSSKDDIDVSKIALKYGGGGHRGAAGFSSDKFLFN